MIATDRDIGDNGRVSFSSFSSENQDYFGVRTSAGNPMTAELYSGMVFDRENPPKDSLKFNDTIKIPVTVKVQDEGSPSLSTNCILLVAINDVNDNSPLFDYSDYRTVVMSNLQQNARVIRVFATDLDSGENARISYSFNNAADDCRSNFAIDPNTGWISRVSSGVLTSVSVDRIRLLIIERCLICIGIQKIAVKTLCGNMCSVNKHNEINCVNKGVLIIN